MAAAVSTCCRWVLQAQGSRYGAGAWPVRPATTCLRCRHGGDTRWRTPFRSRVFGLLAYPAQSDPASRPAAKLMAPRWRFATIQPWI